VSLLIAMIFRAALADLLDRTAHAVERAAASRDHDRRPAPA
jgi:hypothetical protein